MKTYRIEWIGKNPVTGEMTEEHAFRATRGDAADCALSLSAMGAKGVNVREIQIQTAEDLAAVLNRPHRFRGSNLKLEHAAKVAESVGLMGDAAWYRETLS